MVITEIKTEVPEKNTEINSLAEKLKIYVRRNIENVRKPIIDLSVENNMRAYKVILADILKANEPENKKWIFDENKEATTLLLAWWCNDAETFQKHATAKQTINKDIFLCGVKGSGKSSTIYALNEMAKHFFPKTKLAEKRQFKYVEQNRMANTYEIESNINKYTFNESNDKFEGNPHNIILDDLKLNGLTKSFGTDFKDLLFRFLYDRYSIWLFGEARTVITSLLTPEEMKTELPSDLYNRFLHQYNLIVFTGQNRKS